jgi:hypothetical protein
VLSGLATLGRQFVAAMQDFERHYVSQVAATTDEGDRTPETKRDATQQPQSHLASPPPAKDNSAGTPDI